VQYKSLGKGDWELFQPQDDPAERKDLAAERPDKVKELLARWDDYAKANNVILRAARRSRRWRTSCRRACRSTRASRAGQRAPIRAAKDMMADPKP